MLADYLLQNKMTILGTMKMNRRGIPVEMKEGVGRPQGDYIAVYEVGGKMSLHSFLDKKKKGMVNRIDGRTDDTCFFSVLTGRSFSSA